MSSVVLVVTVVALAALAAFTGSCVPRAALEPPRLAFAGADLAPLVGGELRLARPLPPPAGALGPVIGFPLRHTDVRARVVGTMVVTTVEQVFENPLTEPTDAVYVFPLGDHAAVSAYRIVIGARTIEGVIQRRADARATYDAARSAGHTAALLEQVTANVFSQRLANLAPGEPIAVRFEVSEPLAVRDGQLELVFPLTVGPRYLPATRRGAAPVSARQAADPPTTGENSIGYVDAAIAGTTVSFTAELDLPVAPSTITSPSHELVIETPTPGRTIVRLAARDELPNRDLVLRFRAGDQRTALTATAHRLRARPGDDDGGYALLSIVPPLTVSPDELTARDVVILIDRSGSMADGGLAQAQAVARALIAGTEPGDTVDVLAFADDVSRLVDAPLAVDDLARIDATRFVDGLVAGGGTPLERGVLEALDQPVGLGRIRTVYVISDGLVGNDDVVVDAARGALGGNRVYPIGIGAAPNRYLLDELARVGRGFATYVGLGEPATAIAGDVVARSRAPYLTDVTIDWGGLAITDQAPAVLPDVHAGLPLTVAVRYATPATGTVVVHGALAGRPVSFAATLELPTSADHPAVRLAWARARIDELLAGADGARELPAVASAIEALGLRYRLVTRETSFVAVDRTRIVAPGGAEQVIEAPASVPEGVDLERVAPSPPPTTVVRGSRVGSARELGYPDPPSRHHGNADPLTLVLALALAPLAWLLGRRGVDAAHRRTLRAIGRDAPWTVAVALAAIVATALALTARTACVVAPLAAVAADAGAEPWRLLTGPLIHGTWGHLVRDVALVLLVGLIHEPARRRATGTVRYPWLVLAGLALPTVACLASGAALYLGLSGLSHALLAAALVHELGHRRGWRWWLGLAVGALTLAKVGHELVTGRPAFPMDLGPGAVPATLAHAVGLATGVTIAVWPRPIARVAPVARARSVSSSRRERAQAEPHLEALDAR